MHLYQLPLNVIVCRVRLDLFDQAGSTQRVIECTAFLRLSLRRKARLHRLLYLPQLMLVEHLVSR